MEDEVEVLDARGTKRTCQNSQCGGRFYDLNRDPMICPMCDTPYIIASAPPKREAAEAEKPKEKVAAESDKTEESTDDDVELVSLEDAEVEVDDDDADDTFLEEEDDDTDPAVGNVIVKDDDEDS